MTLKGTENGHAVHGPEPDDARPSLLRMSNSPSGTSRSRSRASAAHHHAQRRTWTWQRGQASGQRSCATGADGAIAARTKMRGRSCFSFSTEQEARSLKATTCSRNASKVNGGRYGEPNGI